MGKRQLPLKLVVRSSNRSSLTLQDQMEWGDGVKTGLQHNIIASRQVLALEHSGYLQRQEKKGELTLGEALLHRDALSLCCCPCKSFHPMLEASLAVWRGPLCVSPLLPPLLHS